MPHTISLDLWPPRHAIQKISEDVPVAGPRGPRSSWGPSLATGVFVAQRKAKTLLILMIILKRDFR